jgi:plasmid maintenance system antidote protein VapI
MQGRGSVIIRDAKYIRSLFKEKGLETQEEMAAALGLHVNSIARMLKGQNIHRSTAVAIARYLDTDEVVLFKDKR